MSKKNGHDLVREEIKESMIKLDSSESIDKNKIEREIDRRRLADSDSFGVDQQEKALLLLAFVRSVERGFYPEKEVITKVASCFQEVLQHTTHHYSQNPPEHWWTAYPYTTAKETGKAFVSAFDMSPNSQKSDSAKRYAETLAVREKLAQMDFEHRQANPGKGKLNIVSAFVEILKSDQKRHIERAAERLYRLKTRSATADSPPVTIAQCKKAFKEKQPEILNEHGENEYRKHRDRVKEFKAYISSTERESMDISVSWLEAASSKNQNEGDLG